MVAHVLIVCTANVCRSPYLAGVLTAKFAELGLSDRVEVGSRGTRAVANAAACSFAVERIPEVADHRSQLLLPKDVRSADLILTATVAERSVVAQAVPGARTRSFTIREALALDAIEATEYASAASSDRSRLRLLGQRLHDRRGLIPVSMSQRPVRPSRWRFSLPRTRPPGSLANELDVPDCHGEGAAAHAALFSELDGAADRLVDLLKRGGLRPAGD